MRVLRDIAIIMLFGILAMPVWAAPTPADQAFATARQLYRTENDAQAIVELKSFIATYPTDARVSEATYMLGYCYQRQGKTDDALTAYAQVVKKATGTESARLRAETYMQMGDCYQNKGNYADALTVYDNAQKLVTDDADFVAQAQYWKASCLYQLGRGKEAAPIFQKVADNAPKHPLASWSLYSVGMIKLELDDPAGAIAALDKVIAQYPDAEVRAESSLALAQAYAARAVATKDPATATADFIKAVPLFQAAMSDKALPAESRQRAALALAEAYADVKDVDKAASTYGLALVAATGNAALEIRLARADLFYNAGRHAEAATDYAAVADGKDAEMATRAKYWLGNSQYQQGLAKKDAGQFTTAATSFRRFLDAAGTKHTLAARATLLMGLCQEELADLGNAAARQQAVAAYTQLLATWPTAKEAEEANAGISRQTAAMSSTELAGLLGTLPAGTASWNAALRLAREQYQAGKFEDSLATAKKLLDGKPAADVAARAAYLVALDYARMNKPKEAIPFFKQAQAGTAPEVKAPAQRGLTQAYLALKQFPEAQEAARALVALPNEGKTPEERETELAERLLLLAEACVGAAKLPEAADVYARVRKECPTAPQMPYALMGSAWVAETRKDPATANALYEELVAKYPKHELIAEAWFRLGANLSEMKQFDRAIAALQQVPASYPQADQAAYKIAWAFRDSGKPAEADTAFQRLTEQYLKSPLAAASLFHLGESALEAKRYADAQGLLQRALDGMAPDYKLRPYAAYKLGVASLNAGDNARAAAAFTQVTTGDQATDALFWKGQALEGVGGEQLLPARDAYAQYIAAAPAGGLVLDALLGAGRVELQKKDYPNAKAHLRQALDQAAVLGEKDPALTERAKSVQPEAQYLLGQAAVEEKQYPDAIRLLAAVSLYNLEPWYSRSLLLMARASALSGDPAAATKTLQLLKNTFPESDAAKGIPGVAGEFGLTLE